MLDKVLPARVAEAVAGLNYAKLYEIRLRANRPVVVNYGGEYFCLTASGATTRTVGADVLTVERKEAEAAVYRAAEYSLYAVNEQLKQAFITITGGIRIGVAGELVAENGGIKTVKNFTSLNIRVPHAVEDCGLAAFRSITVGGRPYNALIISPPGAGKTTVLRDIARLFGQLSPIKNVLVLDERSEIAAVSNGAPQLNVGAYTDVLTNCGKAYGFGQGIRSLRPDVIITDELATAEDVEAAAFAAVSGVTVVASAHGRDHLEIALKKNFAEALKGRVFERLIVLSARRGPGTYEGVYDSDFNPVSVSSSV